MIQTSPIDIVNQEFRQALLELIETYSDVPPSIEESIESGVRGDMTAIIGLADPQIAASLSITTTSLASTKLATQENVNARDWLGELSNQLAGRLKNKLIAYGRSPNLTTPTTVTGAWLLVEPYETQSHLLIARFGEHVLAAQLILDLSESLQLEHVSDAMSSAEGSMELF
jgi:CheY-specific phosphatase CheX